MRLHNLCTIFCRTAGNSRVPPELRARRTCESEHLHYAVSAYPVVSTHPNRLWFSPSDSAPSPAPRIVRYGVGPRVVPRPRRV